MVPYSIDKQLCINIITEKNELIDQIGTTYPVAKLNCSLMRDAYAQTSDVEHDVYGLCHQSRSHDYGKDFDESTLVSLNNSEKVLSKMVRTLIHLEKYIV